MNKYFLIIAIISSIIISSCSVVPMTGAAKEKYIAEEKKKADALALADVTCTGQYIEKRMLETRSDLTLRDQKNSNFKLNVAFLKEFNRKYKGDTIRINEINSLMETLGPKLEICVKAKPLEPVLSGGEVQQ